MILQSRQSSNREEQNQRGGLQAEATSFFCSCGFCFRRSAFAGLLCRLVSWAPVRLCVLRVHTRLGTQVEGNTQVEVARKPKQYANRSSTQTEAVRKPKQYANRSGTQARMSRTTEACRTSASPGTLRPHPAHFGLTRQTSVSSGASTSAPEAQAPCAKSHTSSGDAPVFLFEESPFREESLFRGTFLFGTDTFKADIDPFPTLFRPTFSTNFFRPTLRNRGNLPEGWEPPGSMRTSRKRGIRSARPDVTSSLYQFALPVRLLHFPTPRPNDEAPSPFPLALSLE